MADFTATERGVSVCDEGTMLAEFCAPGILRIRGWRGDEPRMSPLLRYDLWRRQWPQVQVETRVEADGAVATTDLLAVEMDADASFRVLNADGAELLATFQRPMLGPAPGFRARFALEQADRFYGLGDQTRERIQHRGTSGDLWVRNVEEYIPIPFVISTRGVGLLVQTTRRVLYDLGATSDDWFGFEAEGQHLDLYVIYGPEPLQIVERYTRITGRPMLPPRWGLGLWFICRTQADAKEFTDDCRNFRREGIPCDCIGLEPGWMQTNYDASVEKTWSDERFRIPPYSRFRHTFFAAAQRMGFKPGLWLCNDYDLSYEEERRVDPELKQAEQQRDAERAAFATGHEVDERPSGQRRLDRLTRQEEPWFQHLQRFVDEGAHWFKQDGAYQVLEHPDRLWGNGMTDAQMHNLYPLIYSKQMYLGFREHTERRTFPFTPAGWAGLQRWTGTWTGDTGGEEGPLGACLNLSLSGHGLSTVDMEAGTPEGIHFGFLLPWAQLNSWNYWRHPWLQGERLQCIFTDYARLRYRLLPYLYSCAWQAHRTGVPMMRAMPLVHDQPDADECLRQFYLGPSLLAGCFTDRLWVPGGQWHNFWTGERLDGGGWISPEVPEGRGGPLLAPAGGMLLMGPEMDYVGQRPDDELTVHVFAGAAGEITLYEDDGETFAFEEGEYRTQRICHEPVGDGLGVHFGPAEGEFEGALARRELTVVAHGLQDVTSVVLDGEAIAPSADGPRPRWQWQANVVTVELGRRDVGRLELVIE
ncbi:MAG: glycoside hydrolase family 31 protein [Armatimonadota bacterium]|nr:glycoside hydrolase family 31 protein [Armatimonadota bacterium]